MSKRTITRRQFLEKSMMWAGLATIPGLSSACSTQSAALHRQQASEAQNLSMKEIAHRKLHHGDGCFLNLFGGPLHGNPWRPSMTQSPKKPGFDTIQLLI